MSAERDYWHECIAISFEDNGITASDEQIANVAGDVEAAHQNYGMAFYQPTGPSQTQKELDAARKELHREQNKIICPDCGGKGRIITLGPIHSSDGHCTKCRGTGRCDP